MHWSTHKSGDIFATSATTYKLSCCWIQLLIVFSSENSPPSNVVVYTQAVDPIISLIGHGMPNMTILLQRPASSSIDNDYLSIAPLAACGFNFPHRATLCTCVPDIVFSIIGHAVNISLDIPPHFPYQNQSLNPHPLPSPSLFHIH